MVAVCGACVSVVREEGNTRALRITSAEKAVGGVLQRDEDRRDVLHTPTEYSRTDTR